MIKEDILEILHNIEKTEKIEILYACEAGNRVLGFANENSDYNIRFIYKKEDYKDYFFKKYIDVIECEGDGLDILGFDIKKALNLHYMNNGYLREWMISNQVYIDKGIDDIFLNLGGFDLDVLKNHYADIALRDWRRYCPLEFKNAKTEKYLRVIRSILCWKLLDCGIYPPINLNDMINHQLIGLDKNTQYTIGELIDYHCKEGNLSEMTMFKLDNFILNSLSHMDNVKTDSFKDLSLYEHRFNEILIGGE